MAAWRRLRQVLILSLLAGPSPAQNAPAQNAAAPLGGENPAPNPAGDKIHGFDLDTLALATAKSTAFSTQYGAARWESSFDSWLRGRGLSLADYEAAYKGYLKRFDDDASGRLEGDYFSALDRYTSGEQDPDLDDRAAPGLAAEDSSERFNEAYRADAWSNLGSNVDAQADAATQIKRIDRMMAEAQAQTNPAILAMQDATVQKYAAQLEQFRKGTFPGLPPESAFESQSEAELPRPEPLEPAEPSTIGTLHAELLSPLAATRHAAARPFAWECDALGLVAAAERAADPRSIYCQPEKLRSEWLPVAIETLEVAPQAELHFVELLLPYLKLMGFATESRPVIAALRQRLQDALPGSEARIALAGGPEKILLRARDRDLRSALAATEKALAEQP